MLLTGLLGWPVGHSRSPAMHNAAFAAAGIDGIYLPLPVPPDRLGAAVAGLVALGFGGANVTIPHKQTVIPYLDELSPAAHAIGAVNTIVVGEGGKLLGDNTDAPGFLADLAGIGIELGDITAGGALILGAGGSARAVAYALASHRIPTHVLARRLQQAQTLVQALTPHLPPTASLQPHPWSVLPHLAPTVRLIVNCTPLGMTPHENTSPWPDSLPFRSHQILYDLVYNPSETKLVRQAGAAGTRAYNGLGMLLHQGALAWQLWTGRPAPLHAMRAALMDQEERNV